MKTLGERIKILRKSYKLSQARFAEPLGISMDIFQILKTIRKFHPI